MVQQMNVKRFYNNLPFNTGDDTKQDNIPWPSLHTYLKCSKSVTELGCGTGWLCARIKKQYPELEITGIDISKIAIEQACMRSNDVNYKIDNLLTYNKKSDVVISIGVLHHIETNNIKSLLHKAIGLSKKYCFIGLYMKIVGKQCLIFLIIILKVNVKHFLKNDASHDPKYRTKS